MKSCGGVCYEVQMASTAGSATPFGDLDDFLALPRVSGLAVSADGSRVVTTVATLNSKGTEFVSSLWELDPRGQQPARRITHGEKGESSPSFTADGDMLFVAARPTPDDDTPPKSLWRLPAAGGEAVEAAALPGGVDAVAPARSGVEIVVSSAVLPSATDTDHDKQLRKARKDHKVSAVLHAGYPVRHWDHDLGPERAHLFSADGRDLTPDPGDALRHADFDISGDGAFVVTAWQRPAPGAAVRSTLVRIDVATAQRSVIVDDADADLGLPAISPDGRSVAFTRETISTPHQAPRTTLCLMDFDGEPVELTAQWDRWPTSVAWSVDGSSLIVTADDNGRGPLFAVDPASGAVRPIVADDFTYSDVRPAPGGVLFALRSSYTTPPHPVRIDADGTVTELPCLPMPELPGTLTEVTAVAGDGQSVRSWLALPHGCDDDAPAPLLLWIHGGPLASWNAWHWRWNPWIMVARGYAVLLPDPALSTGYGQDFIQRGWGAWGSAPYTDLLAATDAACAHPGVDPARTAAMGGSFGGYMANWIAGHTDRFSAIVTHASLWALDQFGSTTDGAYWWAREMTPEMAAANSPHLFVSEIATPMLVIHGDKDYRVPIGEALRLWYELLSRSALPAGDDGSTAHRFLYFPSENHWVLNPQHAKIWYQVVTAFLSTHVLGEDVELPEMLG
ncbi:Dipeptidyl-peptidase 5 [Mycolicibacterium vanbaalenii]|uniref:Dipeptidyl-peptidase 5 n=2 Tax=Mycolicibacterium vanbaalenii TaxID=110539 RepID=A0A5S9RA19_MYCVN|nr:Dipeptidyl-peptidase 5 [Mycolicibacterium vanbaalenii]